MKYRTKGSILLAAWVMGSLTALANTTVVMGEEQSIQVEGTIEPMVASLSIPSKFSFHIDPNNANGDYFSTSEYELSNRSDVPLKVFVDKFEASKADGVYQFTDVLPTAHKDWLGLSEAETMRDFALGLKVVDASEWVGKARTETIWAKEVQDSTDPIEIGVMPDQNGSVHLTLEAKHGLKFSKRIAPSYEISLLFEFEENNASSGN